MKKTSLLTAFVAAGLFTSIGIPAKADFSEPLPYGRVGNPVVNQNDRFRNFNYSENNFDRNTNFDRNSNIDRDTNQRISSIDQQFMMDAARGGMAEVRMGELALQKSTNSQVRDFAQRMIQEHRNANQELMRIAAQKGVSLPTDLGKYQAAFNQLQQLSGAEFDRAYLNEAGVNAHQESAALYQRQSQLGQDADLRAFASSILPAVQGHLQMAAMMSNYRLAIQDGQTRNGMNNMNNMMMPNGNSMNNNSQNQDSMPMMR